MTELIFGIMFVMLVGLAETQCKKNERLMSFCFLIALSIMYAVKSADWTYILYPIGIAASFFMWQHINQKRKEKNLC